MLSGAGGEEVDLVSEVQYIYTQLATWNILFVGFILGS